MKRTLYGTLAVASALAAMTGTASATSSSLVTALSADHGTVEVTAKPAGTAVIGVAVMSNMAGEGIKYLRIPATQISYAPPAGSPVVDMIANDANSNSIGAWAGRRQTTPGAISPSSMLVSLSAGGWGSGEISDLHGVVNTLRIDTISDGSAAAYRSAGFGVIDDISGPYSPNGVSAINPQAFAAEALARWKANPNIVAIEMLNEPAGSWFWGSNATSEANVRAYATLLRAVGEAFAPYGSARPKLLASYDGGGGGATVWGARWFKLIDPKWIDGVTVHPYGGTGARQQSALGDRPRVEQAHAATGMPVWITEIGWPTAVGQPSTGDSLQWTEAEQAANIASFVRWSRSLGYVADVAIFNSRDYGTNAFYGIETHAGVHKLSYGTLQTVAHE